MSLNGLVLPVLLHTVKDRLDTGILLLLSCFGLLWFFPDYSTHSQLATYIDEKLPPYLYIRPSRIVPTFHKRIKFSFYQKAKLKSQQ